MLDTRVGIATGVFTTEQSRYSGIALRSTDGGQSWRKLDLAGLAFGDLFCDPRGAVCFLSWGYLHLSDDKGKSWESLKTFEGKPTRVIAFAGSNGIMAGNRGMGAYTSDKGKTWHVTEPADEKRHFTCAVMIDEDNGYIAGTKASIFRTTDGGKSWGQELMATSFDVYDLCLIGDWLWAVGTDGGIIRKKVK